MRLSLLFVATISGALVVGPEFSRADGLLYQLPPDHSWVRFDIQYTFKLAGTEQAGQGTGTMTMASVGTALAGSETCRWIEFNMHLEDSGTEHNLIRKLLIPEKYLKQGQNPTEHVVRGWAKFDNEVVATAVPFHGRWPAYLAGPLQDQNKLDKQLVETKLGALECEGLTGWVDFQAEELHMKVTFETRLHETAPFGVVSSRMQFDVSRDGKANHTVDATLKLTDVGSDAETALPDHN